MNIYLLGATGFIGRHLKARLEQDNHVVWSHYRDTPIDQLKWSAICHADLVINAAGNTENEETMVEDNVTLAIEVARCAEAFNKRLIHIGSMMENYPTNAYAQSKLAATRAIKEIHPSATILRPALVYGPDDKDSAFLPTLWRAYIEGTQFNCRDDTRQWVHVDDLAQAIADIVDMDVRFYSRIIGIVHVGGDALGNDEIVAEFERAVGAKLKVVHTMGREYFFPSTLDGWYPRSINKGIRDFVDSKIFNNAVWLGAEL